MPTDLEVRSYQHHDESHVVRLWETVFPDNPPWNVPAEDIRRKLAVQRELFLVGECDGRIVATVMAGFDGHRGWIHRLAVLPEHRRRGFARALIAEAEQRLLATGCPKVNLQVRSTNHEVVAFYERVGYAVEDRVSMGKLLEPSTQGPSQLRDGTIEQRIDVDDRIHATPIRPTDKAAFIEHLQSKEISDGTLRIPFPYKEEHADWFLGIVQQETERHGQPAQFALRDARDTCIGCFGFERLTIGHCAEIGYWLAKPYWGQGIMTGTVRAMCAYGFTQWQLVRITAHVFDFNTASARVLEKNGFQLEGVLRKLHRKGGKFIDSRLYALTR